MNIWPYVGYFCIVSIIFLLFVLVTVGIFVCVDNYYEDKKKGRIGIMKPSCKDCPDRTIEPNCHTTCERYLEFAAYKKGILENKKKNNDFFGYKIDKINRKDKVRRRKEKK